ncbi:MAG: PPA1309 family protein [Gordonia sp. (in: high G+C Gram-positive bacteria)]
MPDTYSRDDLGHALTEALGFHAADAPGAAIVFALLPTPLLAEISPALIGPDDDAALSLLAEEVPALTAAAEPHGALMGFLATASWPDPVAGVAVVVPITVVAPGHETSADPISPPTDAGRRARLAVGALRGGPSLALLVVDGESELRTRPDLAPELRTALAAALDG